MWRTSAMTRLGARALGLLVAATTPLACGAVEEDPGQGGGSSGAGSVRSTRPGGGVGGGGPGGTVVYEMPPCNELAGLDPACGFVLQAAPLLMPNVLLVLDQSGSMSETPTGYTMNKWDALKQALSTALADVQGALCFGLELFPTTAVPGSPIPSDCALPEDRCCEMPGDYTLNVEMGPGTETVPLIIQALNTNAPTGGTPTATALQRAHAYCTQGLGAAQEGDKYVLLVTDGGPNCNASLSCAVDTCTLNLDNAPGCPSPAVDPSPVNCCADRPEGCLDDAQTVAAVAQLAEVGVGTIVVGMPGAEVYEQTLESMALQSSFQPADSDSPYYLLSADRGVAELSSTFLDILTGLVTDCEVPLYPPEGSFNFNEVNVAVDCVLIPMGTPQGEGDRWYYDDPDAPTIVIIDGPICDRIQTEGVERIDVVTSCPTVHAE